MKDCQAILEELFLYIDREMDETNSAEFKKHLDLCRPCLDHVEFEKILRARLQEKTNHCCPDKIKDRIKKIISQL